MESSKVEIFSCLENENVKPQPHQKNIVKFLLRNKHKKGMLVFHGVGTGKTLTSIFMVRCLMKQYPYSNVIVLTPTSLIGNYFNEIDKFGLTNEEMDKLTIETYGKFINKLKKGIVGCHNSIVVIDEAHNFRSLGSSSKSIMKCTDYAKKVILLSATPIHNNRTDLANLIAMITNYTIREATNIISSYKEDLLKRMIKCNVSYYKTRTDSKDFAKQVNHIKRFHMESEYYAEYLTIQEDLRVNGMPIEFMDSKNLTVFLNGVRRAVNKINTLSPKILWSVDKIMNDIKQNKKVLVYSNWVEFGVNLIKNILKATNIDFSEITGTMSAKERDQQVVNFNRDNGTNIMIITSAGGEGISLKNTRTVIILEPHWNNEKINQIMGRSIRYKSHISLPEKERVVDVYSLILSKPKKLAWSDNVKLSADDILFNISQKKDDDTHEFYKQITKYSIENDTKCSY